MQLKLLSRFLIFGALALSSASASTIQATFTGVNGENAFGYYIGAYYGQLESQNVSLYCDDFANEVNFGQTWQANLSKITASSDLSNTRYGDTANALTKYQEIAWLDTQFATQSTSQWGDIHATIWQMFDPAEAPTPSSDYWRQKAQENYMTLEYDNFRVVTNEGPVLKTGQVQEFLTMLPAGSTLAPSTTSNVPEPASAVLMGSVLLLVGLGGKAVRKRRTVRTAQG